MENATKALLRFKGVDESKLSKHGISSVRDNTQKTNLKDAKTKKGWRSFARIGKVL